MYMYRNTTIVLNEFPDIIEIKNLKETLLN
jgi:hypothetical protein